MAKMFYTSEEAAARLKVPLDQLKVFVTENKLREFRDGARVMFKVDQVDKLASEGGKAGKSGAPIQSGPSDSGIQLAASDSAHGDAISLADSDTKGTAAKADTVVTAATTGKSIFDTDGAKADSSAQTQIQPAVEDQLSLEGVGSGSGLLDLTRESDDTSLGAELLDEIYPGGEKTEGVGSSSGIFDPNAQSGAGTGVAAASGLAEAATEPAPAFAGEAIIEEARDPSAGAFGGMAFAAFCIMILASIVVAATYMGTTPSWLDMVQDTTKVIIFAVILAVVSLLFAGVGFFVGKATTR